MIQITLTTHSNSTNKGDLYIDYQSDSIGFTVVTKDNKQYDFSIEKNEWESFKVFIETEMKRE